jgi:hypothetical protein
MRFRRLRSTLVILAGLAGAGGCGGHATSAPAPTGESTGDQSAADTTPAPPANPVPSDWTKKNYSSVDLLVADAWAECAYKKSANGTAAPMASPSEMDATDLYLSSVAAEMQATCSTSPAASHAVGLFDGWVAKRGDTSCYASGTTSGVALDTSLPIPVYLSGNPEVALRTASVNYCIAQRLRAQTPGASVGQALVMPLQDQMQLLQIIHERAQIAMLQYGLLGMAFTSPSQPTGLVKSLHIATEEGAFLQWAQTTAANASTQGMLTALGGDFAGAIQLDLAATQELAELFSDQAAADEAKNPIGQQTISDLIWGTGSWRQRLLGLLYGGDPLVQGAARGAVGSDSAPGIGLGQAFAPPTTAALVGLDNPSELAWPASTELPYAQVSVTDAHVAILLGLAQQLDAKAAAANPQGPFVLDLKLAAPVSGAACRGTDLPTSANQLYATVEAALETQQCAQASDAGVCAAVNPSTILAQMAQYQGFALYKDHQITPQHAYTLVQQLDDLIGDDCGGSWSEGARVGALDVGGSVTPTTVNGDSSWRHIAAGTQFAPRVLSETAPVFARLGRFRVPKQIDYAVPLDQQGLVSGAYFNHAERKRALGAIQAFAATREAIENAAEQNTPAGNLYLSLHAAMADAISAAIGDSGVSFSAHAVVQPTGKPAGVFGPDVSPRQPAVFAHSVTGVAPTQAPAASAAYDWDVDVTVPSSDTFWSNNQTYTLLAVPNDPHAATFARFPSAARDGESFSTMTATAAKSAAQPTMDQTDANGHNLARFHFQIALPRATRWTFLVQRADGSTELLAANVTLASFSETVDGTASVLPMVHSYDTRTAVSPERPFEGQYLAFDGHFGTMALRTLAPDTADPSQPAYDGFGLKRHMVPPPDPASLAPDSNGASAQTLVQYHLGLANQMATNLQTSVKTILTDLTQAATDGQTAANAQAQNQQTTSSTRIELCGQPAGGVTPPTDPDAPGSSPLPMCDTKMESKTLDYGTQFAKSIKLDPTQCFDASGNLKPVPNLSIQSLQLKGAWQQFVPTLVDPTLMVVPDPGSDLANAESALSTWLDCATYSLLRSLNMTTKEARAVRVATELSGGSAPPFAQYEGGTLKSAFGKQWQALQDASDIVQQVMLNNAASKQHLASFIAAFQAVQGKAAQNCSPAAMIDSTVAGVSVGASAGFAEASVSVNFSLGPLIAQQQKCLDMKADIDPAAQQAVSNMWDQVTTTMSQATKLTDASAAIQDASAQIAQLVTQADMVTQQANLTQQIADNSLVTSFGLWRTIYNQELYEAQRQARAARIEALIARRAIESTYVVDLSKIAADQQLVVSPRTWADDVYKMDLDIAAAAQQTVGTTSPTSIYPYALSDYVTNLSNFVNGFFSPEQAVSKEEVSQVVNLAGPVTVDPIDQVAWSFFCPTTPLPSGGTWNGTWVEVPAAADEPTWAQRLQAACPIPITRAKVRFSLDPWGRLGMTAPHTENLSTQVNSRWEKFVVNLEGTSVCDVPPPGSPTSDESCLTNGYAMSTLTQIAPTWTVDTNANWATLGFPNTELQGVYAIEAGWTVQASSWTDSNFGPLATSGTRRGLWDHPFGSMYELDVNPGGDPGVYVTRLTGVQLLLMRSFWQVQKP